MVLKTLADRIESVNIRDPQIANGDKEDLPTLLHHAP